MAYADVNLARAYRRAQSTKVRLQKAIEEGATAKKIAHLLGSYERQRKEYAEIKLRTMKL
jgi:alkylhydroperoxidase/carboxymuconolactone decarboxylase family protein YurZ